MAGIEAASQPVGHVVVVVEGFCACERVVGERAGFAAVVSIGVGSRFVEEREYVAACCRECGCGYEALADAVVDIAERIVCVAEFCHNIAAVSLLRGLCGCICGVCHKAYRAAAFVVGADGYPFVVDRPKGEIYADFPGAACVGAFEEVEKCLVVVPVESRADGESFRRGGGPQLVAFHAVEPEAHEGACGVEKAESVAI